MSNIFIEAHLKREGFEFNASMNIPGEGVTVILGPSGSGKTTLLRLLAGLEKPQQGMIDFGDQVWLNTCSRVFIRPQKRNVGVVFQDYALFEHMTVEDNVRFGLSSKSYNEQVQDWLKKLNILDLAKRYPKQLSGGQRQRVALARALITEPDLLLLDEPFSALDTHLRQHLREQLISVMSQLKQPVLMVTHDLNEARYLADTVGVMIDGEVQRMGSSLDVFNDPQSFEVAKVLGWRNFLPVKAIAEHEVRGDWGQLSLAQTAPLDTDWLAIRPEHIKVNTPQANIEAEVIRIVELEGVREILCRLQDGTRLYVQLNWNEWLPVSGSTINLELAGQYIRCLQEGAGIMSSNILMNKTGSNESEVSDISSHQQIA